MRPRRRPRTRHRRRTRAIRSRCVALPQQQRRTHARLLPAAANALLSRDACIALFILRARLRHTRGLAMTAGACIAVFLLPVWLRLTARVQAPQDRVLVVLSQLMELLESPQGELSPRSRTRHVEIRADTHTRACAEAHECTRPAHSARRNTQCRGTCARRNTHTHSHTHTRGRWHGAASGVCLTLPRCVSPVTDHILPLLTHRFTGNHGLFYLVAPCMSRVALASMRRTPVRAAHAPGSDMHVHVCELHCIPKKQLEPRLHLCTCACLHHPPVCAGPLTHACVCLRALVRSRVHLCMCARAASLRRGGDAAAGRVPLDGRVEGAGAHNHGGDCRVGIAAGETLTDAPRGHAGGEKLRDARRGLAGGELRERGARASLRMVRS